MAETVIPESVEETKSLLDSKRWESAMIEELESPRRNKTWKLVELSSNCRPIKNKWIFWVKTKPDGSVNRYKARSVIKGCSQKAGIDFGETFSSVTQFDSVRTLWAVIAVTGYKVYQFDIKTAFLYDNLEETIYMKQPKMDSKIIQIVLADWTRVCMD